MNFQSYDDFEAKHRLADLERTCARIAQAAEYDAAAPTGAPAGVVEYPRVPRKRALKRIAALFTRRAASEPSLPRAS